MKQQLRMLSLAAILGCAVYVFAQATGLGSTSSPATQGAASDVIIVRKANGETLKVRRMGGQGGEQIARKVENAPPRTAIQDAVHQYMCAKQNQLIDAAKAEGREEAVSKIIEANCYSLLTIMTPAQQRHEVEAVWQIEQWAPDKARWREIAKAPSLVKELLKLSPEADKKIRAFIDAAWKEGSGTWRKAMRELADQPGFKDLPLQEQRDEIDRVTKALYAGKDLATRQRESVARHARVIKQAREILTPAQQKELDTIIGQFEKRIQVGYSGPAKP